MFVRFLLSLSLLLTNLTFEAGFAQDLSPDFGPLEEAARKELNETNTPGAAIAVVRGDRIIYAKGIGLANVETGARVTPEMLFRIGSITKMFTAALLVSLTEEKGIKLSEPIGKYVKGLSPKLSVITFHQLLSGTAGLVDGAPVYGPQEQSALSRTVRSLNDEIFFLEPGKLYSYSNLGYIRVTVTLKTNKEIANKSFGAGCRNSEGTRCLY